MKHKIFSREQFFFFPLLIIYLIIIIIFSSNELVGDEIRHMHYAENLAQGFYTNSDNPAIGNGPGYPLFITPFVYFNFPLLIIKLLNALLVFGGILFFYKTLKFYLSTRKSVLFSYILGLYPPFFKYSISLLSEPLSLFLVCAFIYLIIKLRETSKDKTNVIAAGIFLGMLTLTKVIFGYVILFCLFIYSIVFLTLKFKQAKLIVLVLTVGLITCSPFLLYTYSITGKPFYWGTQGGSILYYRSTPFPNEVGNWMDNKHIYNTENTEYFGLNQFRENHKTFIDSILQLSPMDQDSLYKKKSVENIKNHPLKYLQNTLASASRLFFNYPYSYTPQKATSLAYIIPNTLLLFSLLVILYLVFCNLKTVPFEFYFLALFSTIFIGGLILLDGRVRHLSPAIPILLFLIAILGNKFIKITVNKFS
ncbi:glycosyltransferase family 39 protein [Zobellia sp.]|nr:glycosyltransferase family 39 protein [Zobellia sp.]